MSGIFSLVGENYRDSWYEPKKQSLVERYVRDVEVAGSNPVTPIFVCLKIRISFDADVD